jgi:hypothetical protein
MKIARHGSAREWPLGRYRTYRAEQVPGKRLKTNLSPALAGRLRTSAVSAAGGYGLPKKCEPPKPANHFLVFSVSPCLRGGCSVFPLRIEIDFIEPLGDLNELTAIREPTALQKF